MNVHVVVRLITARLAAALFLGVFRPDDERSAVGEHELSRRTMFFVMSLARQPLMVTLSPGLTKFGLKPLRMSRSVSGLRTPKCTTWPFASVTSIMNHECGLTNLTSV